MSVFFQLANIHFMSSFQVHNFLCVLYILQVCYVKLINLYVFLVICFIVLLVQSSSVLIKLYDHCLSILCEYNGGLKEGPQFPLCLLYFAEVNSSSTTNIESRRHLTGVTLTAFICWRSTRTVCRARRIRTPHALLVPHKTTSLTLDV